MRNVCFSSLGRSLFDERNESGMRDVFARRVQIDSTVIELAGNPQERSSLHLFLLI